jgi:hypothetical protein
MEEDAHCGAHRPDGAMRFAYGALLPFSSTARTFRRSGGVCIRQAYSSLCQA